MLLPALNSAREKARRISCSSNLKQIGTAFALYTNAGEQLLPIKGTDPNGNGASALELLRTTGNMTDHKVYICPSSTDKAGSGDVNISKDKVEVDDSTFYDLSYAYLPGVNATAPGDSGIAADGYHSGTTVYNHDLYGNILFADGHVLSSTGVKGGVNWIDKANWYENENAADTTNKAFGQTKVDASWKAATEGNSNGPIIK